MLDTTTKRRIDTARDILVGKVPDPKSQVEQITIALIYKFMDDMDLDAEELGGEPSFFSGEYEKYGWRKIFNPSLGGFEMLNLYSEAILKMAQNPNLPQLFRDVFKNAYLPYRDPETLKSFLKIINDFSYDHSEKLGDAFEYLLSVLGSQGDAGQFRTPRHVIDFMTALIAPKKNETVLDPACGTAGFLISAYKHILKENSSNYDKTDPYTFEQNNVKLAEITVNGKHYKGDKLSPDDRVRIIQNIKGYDISPDMVRLSLVNLYLHGFTDPHIHEYDTLTSEEHWNEFYDIILANPPFMSPKGGIRPHKRFAVQSKRSEVLFVDYMAEHLTPTGKAAIIVPEGIIFQSGTAYKSLRKMLVEDNYLVGVISLPAGVFNPYSGVKTSILWLDKSLAKKTDKILFAKIENDGFDLGAQRRPIKQNDLPATFKALQEWIGILEKPRHGEAPQSSPEIPVRTGHGLSKQDSSDTQILQSIFPNISLIEKERIAENDEFNLIGERYKSTITLSTKYESVKLGDVCEVINGRAYSKDELLDSGKYPVLRVGNFFSNKGWYYSDLELNDDKYCDYGDLLYAWSASFGPKIWDGGKCIYHYHIWKMIPDEARINKHFLYHVLNKETESIKAEGGRGIAMVHITKGVIEKREIPLPPLSVQEEIVAEIESYQKIIDGARQVVENYKPKIDINPEWEIVELGKYISIDNGRVLTNFDDDADKKIACIKVSDMNLPKNQNEIVTSSHWLASSDYPTLALGSIVFPKRGAAIATNKKRITRIPCLIDNNCMGITSINYEVLLPEYLFLFMLGFDLTTISNSAGIALINNGDIKSVRIPLPNIEVQRQIVAQMEKEQEFVNSNKQLIEIFEQKIKDRIAKIWGE
ncbi:MAG: N-6 DNA methylase [Bacteroidales bacterium]|nr:N-6 DNA methylase [Bacteroidales bacterium]